MPNWCDNVLTIYAETDKLNEILEFNKSDDSNLDYNKIIKSPEELHNYSSPNNAEPEVKEQLIKKYGFDNWYDWNINNWGVKWNASDVNCELDEEGNILTYNWCSPWGPPQKWLLQFFEKYHDLNIKLQYEEYGMDFGGVIGLKDDEVDVDEYTLSERVLEQVDESLINSIDAVIKNNIISKEDIDSYIEDILDCLDVENAHILYDTVYNMIEERLEIKEDNVQKINYTDKGEKITSLNL